MNFEQIAPVVDQLASPLAESADRFLEDQKEFLSPEHFSQIVEEVDSQRQRHMEDIGHEEGKRLVQYDKYKKSLTVAGEKSTLGEVVAARHLGIELALPASLESSGDGKKVRKLVVERNLEDVLFAKLNALLGSKLAETTRREDLLKAKAYEEIAKRSGEKSEQLGVLAEQILIGVAETIAIDRPDLGITVLPANAYQDVEEKIDFIIESKQKKRGVGTEAKDLPEEAKSVGVQFTINTSKAAHKAEQIAKAKERGVHVDDIVYVAIEKKMLQEAVEKWTKAGKPISGPWAYLSEKTRRVTLQAIFGGVLSEEQERSLLKAL